MLVLMLMLMLMLMCPGRWLRQDHSMVCFFLSFPRGRLWKSGVLPEGGSAQRRGRDCAKRVSCCSLCCFSLAVYNHWGLPPRLTELGGRAVPAISGRYQRLHLRVHRFGERARVVLPIPITPLLDVNEDAEDARRRMFPIQYFGSSWYLGCPTPMTRWAQYASLLCTLQKTTSPT